MLPKWMSNLLGGKQKIMQPQSEGEMAPLLSIHTTTTARPTPTLAAYKEILSHNNSRTDSISNSLTSNTTSRTTTASASTTSSFQSRWNTGWRNYFISTPIFSAFCGCGRYLPDDIEGISNEPTTRASISA